MALMVYSPGAAQPHEVRASKRSGAGQVQALHGCPEAARLCQHVQDAVIADPPLRA